MSRVNVVKAVLTVMAPLATFCGSAASQAQILNTRPLSQPYTNPTNPNAGEFGSRSAPSYRDLSPQKEDKARRAVPLGLGQQSCWTDSIGKRHCR
jgi:hypothetical protein